MGTRNPTDSEEAMVKAEGYDFVLLEINLRVGQSLSVAVPWNQRSNKAATLPVLHGYRRKLEQQYQLAEIAFERSFSADSESCL